MILLSSKTTNEKNIENTLVGVTFDAMPASPTWHRVFIRVSIVLNSLSDTTRNIRVLLTSNSAGNPVYADTNVEVSNGDADEPQILTVGPVVVVGSEALTITASSDAADNDTDMIFVLMSDDHDYALRYLALAGETADTIAQRLEAIDDLTQASGNGDLAALVTTVGTAGAGLSDLGGMSSGMIAEVTAAVPTAAENAEATLLLDISGTIEQTSAAAGDEHNLVTIILAMLESSRDGTTWTIREAGDASTFTTKTITTNAAALPTTGVT